MNLLTLETDRILLRTLTEADASDEYLFWLTKGGVAKFILNKPLNIPDLKKFIRQFDNNPKVYFLAIIDKATSKHIGNIKFEFTKTDYCVVSMGILIGNTNYHGKGIAGEAIKLFARYAKEKLNTKSMYLGVDKKNYAAIKAYNKIGFTVNNTDNKMTMDSIIMTWDFYSHPPK
jgi:ribosomal-protein-alanine N-acetyltransferase